MITFDFLRFRLQFRAIDRLRFGAGLGGNTIRGVFGDVLRSTTTPDAFAKLFSPRAPSGSPHPSGLMDWPRPFVFRGAHLDGKEFGAGDDFYVDVHVFDLKTPLIAEFRRSFSELARTGLGQGRGRAELTGILQLDSNESAVLLDERPSAPCRIDLEGRTTTEVRRVHVRFLTPTELKHGGDVAPTPAFPILFSRLRDRISTLRALYGPGPLEIGFRNLGERARAVEMPLCDIRWKRTVRKSTRTGQVHPIGGFVGDVTYEGDLREFMPWLEAARWTGIGRQTVWGKGDMRVIETQ